jgi:transposase-like protein
VQRAKDASSRNFLTCCRVALWAIARWCFRRCCTFCKACYEQIRQKSLGSSSLHADKTGWRVSGKTHWLWCFVGDENVFYMIDRSRGSPALQKFFTQAFEGTLITDFWSPYDAVVCADKQKCWPHLLWDAASASEKHGEDPE